jgi:hypothetical protein
VDEMARPKGQSKRMATTNIKVTIETHEAIQVAADMLKAVQSEVILMALNALLPNLGEEINRRRELTAEAEARTRKVRK